MSPFSFLANFIKSVVWTLASAWSEKAKNGVSIREDVLARLVRLMSREEADGNGSEEDEDSDSSKAPNMEHVHKLMRDVEATQQMFEAPVAISDEEVVDAKNSQASGSAVAAGVPAMNAAAVDVPAEPPAKRLRRTKAQIVADEESAAARMAEAAEALRVYEAKQAGVAVGDQMPKEPESGGAAEVEESKEAESIEELEPEGLKTRKAKATAKAAAAKGKARAAAAKGKARAAVAKGKAKPKAKAEGEAGAVVAKGNAKAKAEPTAVARPRAKVKAKGKPKAKPVSTAEVEELPAAAEGPCAKPKTFAARYPGKSPEVVAHWEKMQNAFSSVWIPGLGLPRCKELLTKTKCCTKRRPQVL